MKEEIEREIKSLKNMIKDLRAVLPDVSTEGQNVRLHFYFFHFYFAALSLTHDTRTHYHTMHDRSVMNELAFTHNESN